MNSILHTLSLPKVWLPIAGGVAGTLWKQLEPWTKEWNGKARRQRALRDAKGQVEFWKLWLGVSTDAGANDTEKRFAKNEIIRAGAEVRHVFLRTRDAREWSVAQFLQYKAEIGRVRKFLMLYKEPSERARGFRWFAYLFSIVLVAEGYGLNQISIFKDIREALAGTGIVWLLTYVPYCVAAVWWNKVRKKFVEREEWYLKELAGRESATASQAAATEEVAAGPVAAAEA